ncbi:MAG: hypothetical protein HY907_10265 [Deltaproteobacteria bacterium]|nr:hypothetical protein [Deltaproteobacteria bacterium]
MRGNGNRARRDVAVGLALVLVLGCEQEGQGDLTLEEFEIHNAYHLGPPPECEIPVSGVIFLAEGTLDLAVAEAYTGYLSIRYAWMDFSDGPEPPRTGIFMNGVRLRYEADPHVPMLVESAEARRPTYINLLGRATVGTRLVSPAATEVMLSALEESGADSMRVRVGIRAFGTRTEDGAAVQSPEFVFPITVCRGCLIVCPGDADLDPVLPGCQCNCAATTEWSDPLPCHPGQDDPVDCRWVVCDR